MYWRWPSSLRGAQLLVERQVLDGNGSAAAEQRAQEEDGLNRLIGTDAGNASIPSIKVRPVATRVRCTSGPVHLPFPFP